MIIVPYIHKVRTTKQMTYHTVQILCDSGGEALWTETAATSVADISADILEPNDLVACADISIVGDKAYIPIDPVATNITAMYAYEEIIPGETDILCWRTFIHVVDMAGKPLLAAPDTFAGVLTHICGNAI